MIDDIGQDGAAAGTQSIDRAVALLLLVGRAGPEGARLSELVAAAGLAKPTVRRVLLALMRSGLIEQDGTSRRYQLGPEAYVLGTLANARFGIHALSLDALARLAGVSGDTAFLSVRRGAYAVCLHREEGAFPIRTHVLQAGDRHPLGVGAGSLAMLAALADAEVEEALATTAPLFGSRYPLFSAGLLRDMVARTRAAGYALNPGLVMAASWGIGVAVRGADGRPVGALSIAAIEHRLGEARQRELVPLLMAEALRVEQALQRPAAETGARAARHSRR